MASNINLIFDKEKAINGELQDKGLIPISNIFNNLQYAYYKEDKENIKKLEGVIEEYLKCLNKEKINLVYINTNEDYWCFIEDDE